ncbi:MAG TPA: ABC transporter permease subunit, partial [Polyangiaceae bacterium]|nr:ABC transporter permease subunit [Polyangiaceae bacterium]
MKSPVRTTAGPDLSTAFRSTIARAPTGFQVWSDKAFRVVAHAFGVAVVVLLGSIVVQVMRHAEPAMVKYGLGFLTRSSWDTNRESFGILPEIVGTLYTSILALGLGGVLGVTVALVTSQGFIGKRWELLLKNVIELLAAIPSVVYGLWGIFVLIPVVRPTAAWLHEHLGFLPFFNTELSGPGVLPASLVLAIMILPTITAVSREALAAVPKRLPAAAYGLGATRWEVILRVVLP